MKPMANGIILKTKTVTPVECLHYALNLPTSVVITGIDSMERLEQAVRRRGRSARCRTRSERAPRPNGTERRPGRVRIVQDDDDIRCEASNPEWLGEEPERLQQMVQG